MENWIVSVILFRPLTLIHRHVRHCWMKSMNHLATELYPAGSGHSQGSQFTPPTWPNTPQILPTPMGPAQQVLPQNCSGRAWRTWQRAWSIDLYWKHTWLRTLTHYGPVKANRDPVLCGQISGSHTAHSNSSVSRNAIRGSETSWNWDFSSDTFIILDYRINSFPFNPRQWAKVGSTLGQSAAHHRADRVKLPHTLTFTFTPMDDLQSPGNLNPHESLWMVGGSRRTQREPRQTRKEP